MFNHSCLPNSVHYLVGHAMVVRAVEDVAAGESALLFIVVPVFIVVLMIMCVIAVWWYALWRMSQQVSLHLLSLL